MRILNTILLTILIIQFSFSQTTYYSRQTGAWGTTTTWSTVGCGNATNTGTTPVDGDNVFICDGHDITSAGSITQSSTDVDMDDNASITLTSGSLTLGDLVFSGTSTDPLDKATVDINSGNLTVNNIQGDNNPANDPAIVAITATTVTIKQSYNSQGSGGDGLDMTITGNLTIESDIVTTSYVAESLSVTGNFMLDPSTNNMVFQTDGTFEVTGDIDNTTYHNLDIDWNNYGTTTINGNLYQSPTGGDPNSFTIDNKSGATINLNGDYSNDQLTDFVNSGTFNITSGTFTLNPITAGHQFENANGGVIIIDNSGSADIAELKNIDLASHVLFGAGSTFKVIGADLNISGFNSLTISGQVAVEDGNLDFSGGTSLIIAAGAELVIRDTDGAGSDGKYIFSGGNKDLINSGTFYSSVVTNDGGAGNNDFINQSGATMFIGDISSFSNADHIDNQSGADLSFCGNLTADVGDNIGTNAGTIAFVDAAYTGAATPVSESDFTDAGGTVSADYTDMNACALAFTNESSAVLPVELLFFDASVIGDAVLLEWATASEKQNDYFTVLRSATGFDFKELIKVDGNDYSTVRIDYSAYDNKPLSGISYYMLKQTDFDGTTAYSDKVMVQKVEYSSFGMKQTLLKPNDPVVVLFENPEAKNYLQIVSESGEILHTESVSGAEKVELSVKLRTGVYFLSNTQNGSKSVQPFVVQ